MRAGEERVSSKRPTTTTKRERGLTLGVSNFQRAISMVIPRSRSALSLSRTQAYLKEPISLNRSHTRQSAEKKVMKKQREEDVPFPSSAASFSLFDPGASETEGRGRRGKRERRGGRGDEVLTTSRWYACRYLRTCRSSDRWWLIYQNRRVLYRTREGGERRRVSPEKSRKNGGRGGQTMSERGGLLTDNDDVNVSLFFSHCEVE